MKQLKKKVVIGSIRDPQIAALVQFADYHLDWDRWSTGWDVSLSNGEVTLHIENGGETVHLSSVNTILYIRYPGLPTSAQDQYQMLTLFCDDMVGVARPGNAATNKLSQLKGFGAYAPKTIVTNEPRILAKYNNWFTKSISPLRSWVCRISDIDRGDHSSRLATPTLIQEPLMGSEHKIHFIKLGKKFQRLDVKIRKPSLDMPDYRNGEFNQNFTCRQYRNTPRAVIKLGEKIAEDARCPFIDMDYFISEEGDIKILEWNDSPESASFERRMNLRPSFEFSRLTLAQKNAVFIAPKNDSIIRTVLENAKNGYTYVCLYFDEFGTKWHYCASNDHLIFRSGDDIIIPTGIYSRPVNVPPDRHQEYSDLFRQIEAWDGKKIGTLDVGFYNGSKIFQTHRSLKKARDKVSCSDQIKFPTSWFLKGSPEKLVELLQDHNRLIVKSCSGIRSIVVDQETFMKWELGAIKSVPTLFQVAIEGQDVRIHLLKDQTFSVRVPHKGEIDYRYAKERGNFEHFKANDKLQEFCKKVAELELNPLMGLDFLYQDNDYYCLEANPCPGWNWYYNSTNCKTNHLANGILGELTYGT